MLSPKVRQFLRNLDHQSPFRKGVRRLDYRMRFRGQPAGGERHLILGQLNRIALDQLHAFTLPRPKVAGVSVRFEPHLFGSSIDRLAAKPAPATAWVQSETPTDTQAILHTIASLRERFPGIAVVYLDWFAPLNLADQAVFERVDLYVKKQVLRDKEHYRKGFHGTNLIEYEARLEPSLLPEQDAGVDPACLNEKLFVGWNFVTSSLLIRQLSRQRYRRTNRPIDVHSRFAARPYDSSWYGHMRRRALDAATRLTGMRVVAEARKVAWFRFLNELSHSKLCFSPFGAGEVCWRDFEAIVTGAVLVKPDMSHVETVPDIYRPHETYIPVRWDFSDLQEQCESYLADPGRCRQLARNAIQVWQEYLATGWPNQWERLYERIEARASD